MLGLHFSFVFTSSIICFFLHKSETIPQLIQSVLSWGSSCLRLPYSRPLSLECCESCHPSTEAFSCHSLSPPLLLRASAPPRPPTTPSLQRCVAWSWEHQIFIYPVVHRCYRGGPPQECFKVPGIVQELETPWHNVHPTGLSEVLTSVNLSASIRVSGWLLYFRTMCVQHVRLYPLNVATLRIENTYDCMDIIMYNKKRLSINLCEGVG